MPFTFVDGRKVKSWGVDGRDVKYGYEHARLVFRKGPDPINRQLAGIYMSMHGYVDFYINLTNGNVSHVWGVPWWGTSQWVHSFNAISLPRYSGKTRWENQRNATSGYTDAPQANLNYNDPSVIIPNIAEFNNIQITDGGGLFSWHQQVLQHPAAANGYVAIVRIVDDYVDRYTDTGPRYIGISAYTN